jgi:hypothetical protein
VTEQMRAEIARLVATDNGNRLSQAVRDAAACKESRQSTEGCGCFCCSLASYLRSLGYNLVQVANDRRVKP